MLVIFGKFLNRSKMVRTKQGARKHIVAARGRSLAVRRSHPRKGTGNRPGAKKPHRFRPGKFNFFKTRVALLR